MRISVRWAGGLRRIVRAALLGLVAALPLAGLPADTRVTEAGANAWSTALQDAEEVVHYSIAFKPGSPEVVYAGGANATNATRVYKSSDAGKTWGFTSTSEYTGAIFDIAIPKKEPATVYAGTVFGIWKSTDDGNNWTKANSGLPAYSSTIALTTSIIDLAIDPDNANIVYAGTLTDGLYKSTNAGASWTKLPGDLGGKAISAVAIDPSRPTTVYASASAAQKTTLYRSNDAGATWGVVETGSSDTVTAITVHPADSNKLNVGTSTGLSGGRILRSVDGGKAWSISSFPSGVRSITVHPTLQQTIWAATLYSGVYRSTDGGANWSQVSTGLTAPATVVPTIPASTAGGPQLSSPTEGATLQSDTIPEFSFQLPAGHTASVLMIRPAYENARYFSYYVSRATSVRSSVAASPTKLYAGTTYVWQVRSGTSMPASCSGASVSLWNCANDPAWQASSPWRAFKTPGTPTIYAQIIAINPEAANVVWLTTLGTGLQSFTDLSLPVAPPSLAGPVHGAVLTSLGATLTWTNPPGAAQYQIQIMPANNDGPAFNLIRNADSSFTVQPPVFGAGPYEMLPGMSYTWRVRITTATRSLTENDPEWGPWTEPRTFRTPARTSARLTAVAPADSATVNAGAQALRWDNGDKDVFYYEVQVSGDTRFDVDPATATSFVWWNLVHGGVTTPLNSYQTPPLEAGQTVYWRVRPRVQGDGTPAAWGPVWKFTTKTP